MDSNSESESAFVGEWTPNSESKSAFVGEWTHIIIIDSIRDNTSDSGLES